MVRFVVFCRPLIMGFFHFESIKIIILTGCTMVDLLYERDTVHTDTETHQNWVTSHLLPADLS